MLEANDPRLTAFVLGELDEQERSLVEAEVANSPELQSAVEEIRQASQILNSCFGGEADLQLSDEQRLAIEQASPHPAHKEMAMAKVSGQPYLKIVVSALAIAGAMLIAYLGYLEIVSQRGKQSDVAMAKKKTSESSPKVQSLSDEFSTDIDLVDPNQDPDAAQAEMMKSMQGMRKSSGRRQGFERDGMMGGMSERSEQSSPQGGAGRSFAGRGAGGFGNTGDVDGKLELMEESLREETFDDRPTPPRSEYETRPATRTVPSRTSLSNSSNARPRIDNPTMSTPRSSIPGQATRRVDKRNFSPGNPGRGLPDDDDDLSGSLRSVERLARQQRAVKPAEGQSEGRDDAGKNADESKSTESGGSKGKDDKKFAGQPQAKKWQRDRATPNASRLQIGTNDYLPIKGLQMNVQIDGFRARVILDCYYYNDRSQQLQGSFKLRLPNEASLYYVAFGQTTMKYRPAVDKLASNGFLTASMVRASGTGPKEIFKARSNTWSNVKEARMVPKAKAAFAYSETVRRRVDPALVEWTGSGVFQAKVYPLMPRKLHRVVIGYDVNLEENDGKLRYSLDLPSGVPETMVDVNVSALPGTQATVTPEANPFFGGGRAYFHFKDPAEQRISVELSNSANLVLVGQDEAKTDYFATRVTPELPAGDKKSGSSRSMFLVDTSLSSNPAKFNVWLDLMEATLEQNRDSIKQFAVMFFNVETHWWKDRYVKNTPENVAQLIRDCQTLSLEGATDLGQAITQATSPIWAKPSDKSHRPDVFLLSDGAVTWGEDNLYLISKKLQAGKGATLFAYNTGYTGTAIQTLNQLARETGGAVFSVLNGNEVDKVATAHRRRPWQLVNATVTGSSDLLIAGRIRSIYPGQSLLLVGRGKLGSDIMLKVRRGDEERELRIPAGKLIETDLVARAYGQVAVGQLEDLMTGVEDMATAYARHFRVTGRTCSLLMLESEADYKRFNISPQQDGLTVRTTSVEELILTKLDELYQQLQDPKANVMNWLQRLENTAGMNFKIPAYLRPQLRRLPTSAFEINVPALICKQRDRESLPKKYFQTLRARNLNYEAIVAEAERRLEKYTAGDALKVLSSLIENNPGDYVLARDVAFSAIEWKLGSQAYPLLKRVADARPYQPQVYQAMGQCLASMGSAEMAIICYEVAMNGKWHQRYQDFHSVCAVEYMNLLDRVANGELKSQMRDYARERRSTLKNIAPAETADIIVTMMWNTDRTDVDLHVLEPSGEECYYKHRNTRTGGRITRDVTEGFGPEMYIINKAPKGNFVVKANYYGTDANQTKLRTKVYVTVYENFGTKRERVTQKTVMLSRGKEKRDLLIIERP